MIDLDQHKFKMDTKVSILREPKKEQSKSLTYYIQRIEDLQACLNTSYPLLQLRDQSFSY